MKNLLAMLVGVVLGVSGHYLYVNPDVLKASKCQSDCDCKNCPCPEGKCKEGKCLSECECCKDKNCCKDGKCDSKNK